MAATQRVAVAWQCVLPSLQVAHCGTSQGVLSSAGLGQCLRKLLRTDRKPLASNTIRTRRKTIMHTSLLHRSLHCGSDLAACHDSQLTGQPQETRRKPARRQ